MATTFDELRTCPLCKELGSASGAQGYYHYFVCENPQCRWFHSAPWIRQRRPDGSWVEEQKHSKFFPKIADRTDEVRAAVDEEIRRSMSKEQQ